MSEVVRPNVLEAMDAVQENGEFARYRELDKEAWGVIVDFVADVRRALTECGDLSSVVQALEVDEAALRDVVNSEGWDHAMDGIGISNGAIATARVFLRNQFGVVDSQLISNADTVVDEEIAA